jgi:hypothetical protein
MSKQPNVTREIKALERAITILSPLGQEERSRILAYLHSVFEPSSGDGGTATQPKSARTSHTNAKPLSPQEFLRQYNYKIMTKRIGVMAVFLERHRGVNRFALKDLTAAFREAKEGTLPAQSQYGRAQIMGYIAKQGDSYYATSKAEGLVDQYQPEKE